MPSVMPEPTASRSFVVHSAVTASASRGSKRSGSSAVAPSPGVGDGGPSAAGPPCGARPAPRHAREEPDRLPALVDQAHRAVDERRAHRGPDGREQRHEVALLPTEQLIDRDAEGLAGDVVEGDVDRRLGRHQDPPALEVLAPIEPLPDRAAGHRVVADEEVPVMADSGRDRLLARRQAGLAPADDAGVGLDLDEALGADPDHRDVCPDLGDPHAALPVVVSPTDCTTAAAGGSRGSRRATLGDPERRRTRCPATSPSTCRSTGTRDRRLFGDGPVLPTGDVLLRGLPFRIGEADGGRPFVRLGPGRPCGSIDIAFPWPARTIVVAHLLIDSEVPGGGPVGSAVADYVIALDDGGSVAVPIRELFEIGALFRPDAIGGRRPRPGGSAAASFLAAPDVPDRLRARAAGPWSQAGRRMMESEQGFPTAIACGHGARQDGRARPACDIEASGAPFVVAGVTVGDLDEDPIVRTAREPIRIALP